MEEKRRIVGTVLSLPKAFLLVGRETLFCLWSRSVLKDEKPTCAAIFGS